MVWGVEVEEFVGDDVILEFLPEFEEGGVEGQPAGGRVRRPLRRHRPHGPELCRRDPGADGFYRKTPLRQRFPG